ncbi:hypothetical protein MPC4_120038 [Methylocella tundrae]|uniref:Uncharacterized protein n=1 Tax=Methylocella tundrae TaxID=227605 RepID=A0A8B6M469_METTU|nr:hypothetical protein MPC1_9640002 [Methylocella tundrae]VTZ48912.1 hypothetical protein MPC4_120038 [Methylocella tundrae]
MSFRWATARIRRRVIAGGRARPLLGLIEGRLGRPKSFQPSKSLIRPVMYLFLRMFQSDALDMGKVAPPPTRAAERSSGQARVSVNSASAWRAAIAIGAISTIAATAKDTPRHNARMWRENCGIAACVSSLRGRG